MFKQLQEFLELSGYERAREDLSYEPGTISIPANMTVIWFNNDDAEHSVTVNTGNSTIYLPEQRLIQI
jgi:plastocyanin